MVQASLMALTTVTNVGMSTTVSRRLGRMGGLPSVTCAKPPIMSTRELSVQVRSQGVPTPVQGSSTTTSASTLPPVVRLTSNFGNIVPFLGETDTTYGVDLTAHLAPTVAVKDIVEFASELHGRVPEGKRRRFQGVCRPVSFSFGSEECLWDPEEREVPELLKQHFEDRAVDCGVKAITLVMHSDSDMRSVSLVCGDMITRLMPERKPSKVLSRHV
eukprot:jgi/Botrbrau1/3914/Bobra.0183s0135.1